MAEATDEQPHNSKDQGAGDEGSKKPDFLVDKFGNVEDQAKAYRELEKRYHEDLSVLKAEVNTLKKGVRLEDTQPRPEADEDSQELVDFYKSPSAYRQRVKEEVKQELRKESAIVQSNQQLLTRFFQQNPDLVGQEILLEGYVRQVDAQLDPSERLNIAAKRTREYITNVRKAPEATLNPKEFVDEPSGAQSRGYSKSPTTAEDLRKDFFKSREGSCKLAAKRLPAGE